MLNQIQHNDHIQPLLIPLPTPEHQCPECLGQGWLYCYDEQTETCWKCKGEGDISVVEAKNAAFQTVYRHILLGEGNDKQEILKALRFLAGRIA